MLGAYQSEDCLPLNLAWDTGPASLPNSGEGDGEAGLFNFFPLSFMSQVTVEIGADAANFQKVVNGLPQSVQRVSGAMQAAFAGVGFKLADMVVDAAMFSVEAVKGMDRLRRSMTTLEGSAQSAEKRLAELREAAQLPGVDFEQAVKADVKLRSVGMSAELSKASITEMGNALALAGGTSADLEGVVLALTQIMSKGKISADEIGQIAERVPQVRAVMKDVFGTADTEALQKMRIDSEAFVEALIGGFSSLNRASAGLDEKLSDLSTAVKIAADALLSGLVEDGVNGMGAFTRVINENITQIRELGAALRDAGRIASDVSTGFSETFAGLYGVGLMGGRMLAGQSFQDAVAAMNQYHENRRPIVPESDPFAAVGGAGSNGMLPDGSPDPFFARRTAPKFTPSGGGNGFFNQFSGIMAELSRLMGPAAQAMGNLIMEQSKGLQSRASALGEAAFSALRGDVDTSFGRGRSVNPLTNGASRQISEMMKQSAILEKQASKLDTSNATLKSIEAALKAQRFSYS